MIKNKTNDIPVTEVLKKLDELEHEFQGLINQRDNKKINLFTAAGLTTQEVKHSAFLGWLFDCEKPHKLKNAFLKKFVERLFVHTSREDAPVKLNTNAEILSAAGIGSAQALDDFLNSDYEVYTELSTSDGTGRMDIVIQSESTKTVLVIENKTFTTTHDCQLEKYEQHYRNTDYERKIFVFLTPNNDPPIDIDDVKKEYRPDWCVFDYEEIVAIVKELIPAATSQTNKKLKMIMEDYIDMVDTNILLKNKDIQEKCKEIRNKYGDVLEILNSYTTFDEVIDFCAEYIQANYSGAHVLKSKVAFQVYTDAMIKFFDSFNEKMTTDGGVLKCRAMCQVSFTGNRSTNYFSIERVRPNEWSVAQNRIKDIFGNESTKERMHKWVWSIPGYKVQIVDRDFESYPFEELKKSLPASLDKFLDSLKKFDTTLLNKI